MAEAQLRIDRWLYATRIFKTRPLATKACQAGRVSIDNRSAKPSSMVRPDQIIEIRLPDMTRTVRVKDLTDKRVGPKLVSDFLEELTPQSEHDRRREYWQRSPAKRDPGSGRPTKKERRETDRFFGIG